MAAKDVGRRNDPNYSRLTGLVPKPLAQKIRVLAVEEEVTISELMEEALSEYLQKKQEQKNKEEKSDKP